MEDNRANAESIQKALSEINSESNKIIEDVKKTKSLNEESLTTFSKQLKSFQTQLEDFFPKLSSMNESFFTMDSNRQSERGLIHTRQEDKGTQLENTNSYSPKFNRNESLGKLLCQALKHFNEDLKNF